MFAASESKGRAASLANLPKGAVLLIVLELCERFSFYGMLSLLALFLSDDTASGGFGWTSSRALSVVGIYSALAYSLPVLGGVLADRIWGARRGIAMGATVMTAGHFSMALPAFLQAELAEPALFGAIALLSLGNMLMKSPLTITLGDVFEGEDPRRQTAFAYYYVSISVGGLFAGILVGSVAESIGWHWGFSIAGVSMGFALLIYLSLAPRLLGQAGTKRGESQSSATIFSSIGKPAFYEPALLLVIMAGFICVFEIGWFQLYGSWTVFIRDSVAREIGNWTVPVPWFHAINSAVA
ncbi:MAG: oligopeptide:H+ symporter, partial [Pseudomonadota bacterium]